MKLILFILGGLLLGAFYLWAVEYCRPACLVMWFIIPAYCLAGWAAIEKD